MPSCVHFVALTEIALITEGPAAPPGDNPRHLSQRRAEW